MLAIDGDGVFVDVIRVGVVQVAVVQVVGMTIVDDRGVPAAGTVLVRVVRVGEVIAHTPSVGQLSSATNHMGARHVLTPHPAACGGAASSIAVGESYDEG